MADNLPPGWVVGPAGLPVYTGGGPISDTPVPPASLQLQYQQVHGTGVPKADTSHAASERMDQGPSVTYEVHQMADGNWYRVTYENGKAVDANRVAAPTSATKKTGIGLPNFGAGGGGGMTAYEKAQIELDKRKLADAEAQQKADETYREAQAIDQFNKNWQDYQVKNYYGSFGGPSSAAPAGSPWFYRLPEPSYVKNYYKSNPQAGPDPWSTPIGVSGYSGSGFLNAQQPGTQSITAMGNTPAPITGQTPANPFPGPTTGVAPAFNPMGSQSGQNVPPTPINPPMGASAGMSGGLDANLLNTIQSHPAANQFVMSLPGASEFVQQAMGQTGPSITNSPITPVPGGPNG